MKIGLYPGSFDPITNGHLGVITKGAKLFDKLYVCILKNAVKRRITMTGFTLFRMIFQGILDKEIIAPRNTVAARYPGMVLNRNTEIIKTRVPDSLVLGSSL